jgi:hypothetical protein
MNAPSKPPLMEYEKAKFIASKCVRIYYRYNVCNFINRCCKKQNLKSLLSSALIEIPEQIITEICSYA